MGMWIVVAAGFLCFLRALTFPSDCVLVLYCSYCIIIVQLFPLHARKTVTVNMVEFMCS
jgi:hypothetical protein